jgi:hypothetical protein
METNIFLRFHKQIFCWLDEWIEMTMEDVRAFEIKLKEEMVAVRALPPQSASAIAVVVLPSLSIQKIEAIKAENENKGKGKSK